MYDTRNYRKLFECENEKNYNFCPYYKNCYYKHIIDLDIKQLYFSDEDKNILIDKMSKLTKKIKNFEKIKEIVKLYSCLYCNEIIQESEVFLKCNHYYCLNCIDKMVENNNKLCYVCKYKFIDGEEKHYKIAKLCSAESILDHKKSEFEISTYTFIKEKELVELDKDYFDGEFNEDLMNLFKKS